MPPVTTQQARLLGISTPAGEDVLLISGFSASERISGLFNIDVDLLAESENESSINPDDLLGQPVTVKVAVGEDFDSGSVRHFHGMISRFAQGGRDNRFAYYQIEVVPWLWLFQHKSNCRVFQNMTALEIITSIFDEYKQNFSFVSYDDKTTKSYTKLDCCVQYRESDFNFVSRLMEQEGIYYFFTHSEDAHTLVLADSPQAHSPCPHQDQFRYEPHGGIDEPGNDTILAWRMEREIRPGKYTYRDYHFQMPSKNLEVSETTQHNVGGNGNLEIYDFPGEYAQRFNKPDERLGEVENEARKLIKLRMEEEETPHHDVGAKANARTIIAGHTIELTHHPVSSQNGEYLVTSVRHSATQSPDYVSGEQETGTPYQNTFTCIPSSATFRPARTSPKPVVEGLQSAVVVGPSGEEIYTDKYGRVRIQFHWDREGQKDENSTCWVRVAQSMAGKQWGAHFWPRIGQEVLVAFMEGDPDQPIIVGTVYNGENMPPYTMPDNQTRSGYKTRSSPNGNPDTFNELRFEDKKDQEQIYIHAERNLDTVVENDESRNVGNNRKTVIGGDEFLEVKGVRKQEIGTEKSQGDRVEELIVHGERVENVYGDDGLVVLGSRGRKVQIQQGDHVLEVQAANNRETVAANQEQTIGGNMNTTTGGQIKLTSGGGFTLLNGGNTVVTSGGPLAITSGGPVTVTAPMISLNTPMLQVAGVVQCTSLIASAAVVSPSYTPGVGNIV